MKKTIATKTSSLLLAVVMTLATFTNIFSLNAEAALPTDGEYQNQVPTRYFEIVDDDTIGDMNIVIITNEDPACNIPDVDYSKVTYENLVTGDTTLDRSYETSRTEYTSYILSAVASITGNSKLLASPAYGANFIVLNTVYTDTDTLASAINTSVDDYEADIIAVVYNTTDSSELQTACDNAINNHDTYIINVTDSDTTEAASYPANYSNVFNITSGRDANDNANYNTTTQLYISFLAGTNERTTVTQTHTNVLAMAINHLAPIKNVYGLTTAEIMTETVSTSAQDLTSQITAIIEARDPLPTYTVTFNTNGGSTIESMTVPSGRVLSLSDYTTTRDGYTFTGWYTDSSCTIKADDTPTIMDDTTFYAGWITNYTLTFETNGGSHISSETTTDGTSIDLTAYTPTRDGYTFTGWYTDSACTESAGDSITITSDTTLYAGWKIINPFKDIIESDWYYNDIMEAYSENYMQGTESDIFAPLNNMKRGDFALVLYRIATNNGFDTSISGISFNDVTSSDYFYTAVCWASNQGIVNGTSSTTFEPQASITRQDAVVMLHRFCTKYGIELTTNSGKTGPDYSDWDSVSGYAQDAMNWAIKHSVISGVTDTTIAPEQNIIRAEVATIFVRTF